jgi:hypothetical protein
MSTIPPLTNQKIGNNKHEMKKASEVDDVSDDI